MELYIPSSGKYNVQKHPILFENTAYQVGSEKCDAEKNVAELSIWASL